MCAVILVFEPRICVSMLPLFRPRQLAATGAFDPIHVLFRIKPDAWGYESWDLLLLKNKSIEIPRITPIRTDSLVKPGIGMLLLLPDPVTVNTAQACSPEMSVAHTFQNPAETGLAVKLQLAIAPPVMEQV